MSEKTPSLYRRIDGALYPVNDAALNQLQSLNGQPVRVDIKQPRNLQRHKFYWVLLNIVVENWPEEQSRLSADSLHQVIKIETGHVNVINFNGETIVLPKSISFNKMDEEEFKVFLRDTVRFLCENVIPGLNKNDLLDSALKIAPFPVARPSP